MRWCLLNDQRCFKLAQAAQLPTRVAERTPTE
jgi:hypothetical protein